MTTRKFISWTSGKKTYATVAIGIAVGILQAYGIHIPSYVDWALVFLGIGTTRSAVASQSQASAEALKTLLDDVLSQVTTTVQTDGPSTTTVTAPVTATVPVNEVPKVSSGQLTPQEEVEETKELNSGHYQK